MWGGESVEYLSEECGLGGGCVRDGAEEQRD